MIPFHVSKKTPIFRLLALSLFVALPASAADDAPETESNPSPQEAILNPIIANGTPAEAMKFDPIVPAYSAPTKSNYSTGNIGKELANDLPFHFSGFNKPGNEGGMIGIGKGAEETDVNFLGIPINRPQGGGADLSTFPQFLWSGYTYQLGASLGAYDPRGVAGSLTLKLWTQENMGQDSSRVATFYSTRKIRQDSVGISRDRYALLAGIQTGIVEGGAVSASGRFVEAERFRLTGHLVATQTKSQEFFSERVPTREGFQETIRTIPVLQADYRVSEKTQVKSSVFHDFTYVDYYRYSSPSTTRSRKRTHQVGNETAFVSGNTRIGLGLRHISYTRSGSDSFGANPPSERVINLQATQGYRLGNWLLEPTVGGTHVTRIGTRPYATLGGRHESDALGGRLGKFARAGYHQRFPSLLDRYYENVQFIPPSSTYVILPNAGLKTENVRSVEIGADLKTGDYRAQLTAFGRDYQRARITSFRPVGPTTTLVQIQNAGTAYVLGATHSQDLRLLPIFDIGTRTTFQRSQIRELNADFPYSPEWVGILRLDLHNPDNTYGVLVANKVSSNYGIYSESTNSTSVMPGYYYMDVALRARVWRIVEVTAGVENVFDRPIQFRFQNVDEGRVYTLSASAQF